MVMKYGTIPGILIIGFGAVLLNLSVWVTLAIALVAAISMLAADHFIERRAKAEATVAEDT